jgi:hypothetical protein
METWNAGILEKRTEDKPVKLKQLLQTHHSITPSLHYSNWGEAFKFYYVVMANKDTPKYG